MTEVTTRSRGAALVLFVAGLLTSFLSTENWASCPTTPCGGPMQAISTYSGIDLGFGVVTALAGGLLFAISLGPLARDDLSRLAAGSAVLLAFVIIATVVASVVWMYVIPGEYEQHYRPPVVATLIGIIGFIALVAGLRLLRTIPRNAASARSTDDGPS